MEINDYVISKNRLVIGQITEIFKANEQAKICVDKRSNIIIPIGMNNILKSSPNIIDLIDKGDLVNGYIIVDKIVDPISNRTKLITEHNIYNWQYDGSLLQFYNEDIETVLTKEKINDENYIVYKEESDE